MLVKIKIANGLLADSDMARKRGKKALYEVIGRTRSKSRYSETLERLHPEDYPDQRQPTDENTGRFSASGWQIRPKIIQLNAGRIEVSMPYQLVIAVFLGLVLLFLLFYRLGQAQINDKADKTAETVNTGPITTDNTAVENQPRAEGSVPSTGQNNIVLKQYHKAEDLEQAKKYFASVGIETVIINRNGVYYLISKEKYENPGRVGTDGYHALRRIKEVGANYKAPQGYETFGPKPFQDAYGMRFSN